MARRVTTTVKINGDEVAVTYSRPRTGGTKLMPTRTIASTRDKARRRQAKHRHRTDWA